MRTIQLHPHTGLPLLPLGRRKDGRLIWPIIGAAEDDESTEDENDADDSDADEDADDTDADESEDSDDDGAEDLGDAGKKALDRMKAKLKDERAKRRAAEAKLTDKDGDDSADSEVLAKANARILRSEIRAAAAGKLADPKDAYKFLDLDSFEVDDDGNVDEDEIADAIDDLIKQKPYLAAQGGRRFKGGADGGTRKESRPKQLTRADLAGMSPAEIDKAHKEGRLKDLIKSP